MRESFGDYVHDKVILATRVPVSGDELVSYIIEGIPSKELRTQARIQCYESLEEMQIAFANIFLSKEASRRLIAQSGKSKFSPREQQKPKEINSRKCYNCNEDT